MSSVTVDRQGASASRETRNAALGLGLRLWDMSQVRHHQTDLGAKLWCGYFFSLAADETGLCMISILNSDGETGNCAVLVIQIISINSVLKQHMVIIVLFLRVKTPV